MHFVLIKLAFQSVPSAMNCGAITLHGEDQTHCENEEKAWWGSMIRITVALNRWSRISFISAPVMRRPLQRGDLDAVKSIGALSEVAGWWGSSGHSLIELLLIQSVVVSDRPRSTSLSESASRGLVASTHPRVMTKSAYFILRKCLLGVQTMSVDAWNKSQSVNKYQSWTGGSLSQGMQRDNGRLPIRCQFNNGVFRLCSWRGNAMVKWHFVAEDSFVWTLSFLP